MDDYKIVTDKDTSKVEKEVNKFLKKGYDLHGHLIHSVDHTTTTPVPLFTQVVVKYPEKAAEPKKQQTVTVNNAVVTVEGDSKIEVKEPAKVKKTELPKARPEFYVHLSGGHAWVEIMEPTGKTHKFTLMNCKTPVDKVKTIIQNMFFAGKLTKDNLYKISGIEFTSVATER